MIREGTQKAAYEERPKAMRKQAMWIRGKGFPSRGNSWCSDGGRKLGDLYVRNTSMAVWLETQDRGKETRSEREMEAVLL